MLKSVLISPVARYFRTKKLFPSSQGNGKREGQDADGDCDPCSGNYFQFMSSMFPNCEHGDVTIDLYGCEECTKMDINNISAWENFDDGGFVVMETGVLGFSKDIGLFSVRLGEFREGIFYLLEETEAFFGWLT